MATTTGTEHHGFDWRILLGPTHNWKPPEVKMRKEDMGEGERCELCGELLADGKPFMTNSVGQRAVHIACSGEAEPLAIGLRPVRKGWAHFLLSLVGV